MIRVLLDLIIKKSNVLLLNTVLTTLSRAELCSCLHCDNSAESAELGDCTTEHVCLLTVVLNDPLKPQTPMVTSSRLSKTFHEVLHDKEALPYFIQVCACVCEVCVLHDKEALPYFIQVCACVCEVCVLHDKEALPYSIQVCVCVCMCVYVCV